MKAAIIICVLGAIACHVPARADVYADAARQVEENNPRLRALRYENIAELSALRSENILPAPELEFEHVWATRGGEKKWNAGISQSFDFPGAYRARSKEAAARREALDLRYRAELTEAVLRSRELLIEIAYCNKAIALETAVVNDMNDVSGMLSKAYSGGEATILEVNRAKIEQANNVIKLRELTERREACVAELATLGCHLSSAGEVAYPLSTLETPAYYYDRIDNDASVIYSRQIRVAEMAGARSRGMEMLPGLTVGYVHEMEEGTHFNGFSVGLSLPSFSGKARKAEARALAARAEWEEMAARVERRSVIDVEYRNAASRKELLELLGPVFATGDHIALLAKAYHGGQLSAIDYLREVAYYRESEADFLETELSYHTSLARLDKFQILLNSADF